MKKKLLLITTGGTILQTKVDGIFKIDEQKNTNCLLDQIIKHKEELNIDEIDVHDAFKLDSSNITPNYWKKIIEEIYINYDLYDAFVITHGTDTLSYTCAALSYAMTNISKPVVLTGAQVPFNSIGSAAELNLENAIRVATQEDVKLKGIMCVFGSHIMTGTRVKKISEFSYDAFENFNNDGIGRIGTKIHFNEFAVKEHNNKYGEAKSCKELNIIDEFAMDKVIVLNEFPGMNCKFVDSLVESGVKGIVLRAYADGNSNVGSKEDKFENIREIYEMLRGMEIPLAIISQPSQGNTTMDNYKPGKLAKELGGVPAYDMSTEALTVKLGWLLGQNLSYKEIRNMLLKNIRGEIRIKE